MAVGIRSTILFNEQKTGLKRIEKKQVIGVVRFSDKEMAELGKIEKEMKAGKEKTLKEIPTFK